MDKRNIKIAEALSVEPIDIIYDDLQITEMRATDQRGKMNAHYGKKHSDATKALISERTKGRIAWNKGRTMSDATKKKMSDAKKGKPSNRKGKVPWNKGIKHSTESIKKMQDSARKRWEKQRGSDAGNL